MKPPRLPLYAQFLAWLLLNVVLLAGLLVVFAGRDGLGIEMLLTDAARERAQAVGFEVSRQLNATVEEQWPVVLAELSERYGAAFAVERVEPWRPPGRPRNGFGNRVPGDPWRFRSDDGDGPRQAGPGGGPEPGGGQPGGGPGNGSEGGFNGFGGGFGEGASGGGGFRGPRRAATSSQWRSRVADARRRRLSREHPARDRLEPGVPRLELGVTTHGILPLLTFLGLASWIALLALALLLSACGGGRSSTASRDASAGCSA